MATRLRIVDYVLAQGLLNIVEVPGKCLHFQEDTRLQPSDPTAMDTRLLTLVLTCQHLPRLTRHRMRMK
jgi:hypothetical protein